LKKPINQILIYERVIRVLKDLKGGVKTKTSNYLIMLNIEKLLDWIGDYLIMLNIEKLLDWIGEMGFFSFEFK
jgi:hypothetical protein